MDEREFESPGLLRRDSGLSPQSLAIFGSLVDRRRELASTREAFVLPNATEPGFTIVHVVTGIMASFRDRSGWGTVLAKSYSNPLKPTYLEDSVPLHFYSYGLAVVYTWLRIPSGYIFDGRTVRRGQPVTRYAGCMDGAFGSAPLTNRSLKSYQAALTARSLGLIIHAASGIAKIFGSRDELKSSG